MSRLGRHVAPIGRDRPHGDVVAGFEGLDLAPYRVHDADGLVPQGEVFARADRPVHRVCVGRADQRPGRLHDRVVWAGTGNRLIGEADLAYPFHHEGSHRG